MENQGPDRETINWDRIRVTKYKQGQIVTFAQYFNYTIKAKKSKKFVQ